MLDEYDGDMTNILEKFRTPVTRHHVFWYAPPLLGDAGQVVSTNFFP
jgi:hypothetical protein